MGGGIFKVHTRGKRFVAVCLIAIFLLTGIGDEFLKHVAKTADAAQTTLDSNAFINGPTHYMAGSQTVFIDDQTGYKFFRDAPGYCVYRKTTDGGATWSSTTTVDSRTNCISIQVWYDRWTPGDTGNYIHIATIDTVADDIFYNRVDTANSDTLLMGPNPVDVSTNSGNSIATLAEGANTVSITKATDGTLYTGTVDASDSYVVKCSTNCNLATGWTEAGVRPFGLANNYAIFMPLSGGDIIAINRDLTLDDLWSKVYTSGTNSWGATTTFESNAPDNTTYDVGMAAAVSSTTGDVYLAYIARNAALGNDDQIRTALYSGGSWTAKKEVARYSEYGLTNVAIALDYANDDVYVAYTGATTPTSVTTANVYWRKSSDTMNTWSFEKGPINSSPDDFYGLDLNMSSDERIYATWFDNTDDDIYGNTVVDLFPGINATTTAFESLNDFDSYTQVTLDSTANINGTSHIMAGSQTVFIDDQTGYKFFRDAPGYCVYRKTTDGGATWSGTTTVDAQIDCTMITVWYDKWTPGSASSSIHIATLDIGNDDIWYNRLDPSDDTLLLGSNPVSMLTGSGQGGTTLLEGENFTSITRGTDGTLYAVSNDGTGAAFDSFIVECTSSCNNAAGWTETVVNPLDVASDQNILMPLSGGNIMLINRDISAGVIRYKIWDNANWSGSWTNIDASAPGNATYDVGMAVAVSSSTNDLYLAYIARNATPGSDDQIRTARYTGGAWSATTNIVGTTPTGLTNIALALDYSNDDVYVAYSTQGIANTANTANVLWRKSTNDMITWSFENGPVNTSADDLYGVDLNMSSNERLFVSWFDNTDDDIYGATLVNLPSTAIATTGAQTTYTYASTSNVYIGGVIALYNTVDSQTYDVTGITLTEGGTIDGSANITNVKLLYETDATYPYDCDSVTYDGNETQFGSTDTNGFSGADGVSSFTGSTVNVSTTTTLCLYPVMSILDSAESSSTIDISIADPTSDIAVTNDVAGPNDAQNIPGTTFIYNDESTLTHYHWRNDDGTESDATSKTSGTEDTALTSMKQGSTTRLRVEVSNEGSSSTPAMQYRLEYASNPGSCSAATGWTDVGAAGGDFDMSDSSNLTEGGDTTNIGAALGGVTDSNSLFLTPNGGVRDTSSQTGNISLSISQFSELEYSIVASTSAQQGNTYCFRVTNQGTPLFGYDNYPRANINADVLVTIATSSQSATTSVPSTNFYVGSHFVITENSSTRNVTGITITEDGSVDAQNDLDNIKLRYDLDTTNPYDCAGESYSGSETQFGSTDTDGFSGANGTSTFSGSVAISTTSTMCLYAVFDVTEGAQNGETINISIENPSTNLVVSGGGSVGPSIARDLNGSTTLQGPILTQTHYHWRADDGNETTASSLSGGSQDTAITNVALTTPIRLRLQVSNEGAITSASTTLQLEYGAKITTCSSVSSWTDVGLTGGAWDMYDSSNLNDGDDTTDVANASGGVSNENASFKSPNSAVKDSSSRVATTTLTSTEYIETEYSLIQTPSAGYDIPYCFRLTNGGTPLNAYTTYGELRTSPERDFEIQRNSFVIATSSTSTTLVAGVHYTAPSASTSAFIRITNTSMTGAGHDIGAVAAQNATNTTVYIVNPSNIMNSVTFARTGITNNTKVFWEIVEFIGEPGSDNEMIVRSQTFLRYGTASTSATGTVASNVSNDADVVVFITGQQNPDTGSANYESGLNTSEWNGSIDAPIFRRGVSGGDAGNVSYAVVEFTGQNWNIQRSEHTFTSAGTTETEAITAVNSLSRTFVHAQKRNTTGLSGTDEFGHEVWLSSIGYVSYFLQSGATTPSGQTSVAWIIENTQTSSGAMDVERLNGFIPSGGVAPQTTSVPLSGTLDDLTNTSIFANARSSVADNTHPRAIAGVTIASTTAFELWRSNTGSILTYRAEVVEWPTAGLAIKQNHYRFYVDNNQLLPTEEWPPTGEKLGEDTVLTGADEPLGEGERIRIRMSLLSQNATFPAGTRAFKLQYGQMVTTCSAISESSWTTLGDSASSTIWRGQIATGTTDGTLLSGDPPTGGDLLLTNSAVAGTFEEANDTSANTYAVEAGDEIEYDWLIEQNGANAETYYCFRMVETDGTPLDAYSTNYPQIRTASFTPRTQNWRWYGSVPLETPTTTLTGAENVAPADIANGEELKLRITVKEIKNISRDDVRFRLQYSEYANFLTAYDVVATTTCTATSTWCYADGGGEDNAEISTGLLTDAESCVGGVGTGCGTHNESPTALAGFRHDGTVAAEYEFTLKSAGPRVNRVYYFRLYDVVQDIPVPANTDESYPSLVTEGASLVFTMTGLGSTTVIEGVTLDIDTTPTRVPFGTLPINTSVEGAHRLAVNTNGTEGYQLYMTMTGDLQSAGGTIVLPITGTNAAPVAWSTGCAAEAASCLGYHTSDDTLFNNSTRFSAVDTYARFSTTSLEEISYSSQPTVNEITDIVFRIFVRQLQSAGIYETNIQYISVPLF